MWKNIKNKSCKGPRILLLRFVHGSIELSPRKLSNVAVSEVVALSSNEWSFILHCLLVSYVADISEAEDMLSVKRCTLTDWPCFRWVLPEDQFSDFVCGESRTLDRTKDIFWSFQREGVVAKEELASMSMPSTLPVLSSFTMMGIHPRVDNYSIFCVEPIRNISLGVSRILKECTVSILRDDTRTTSAIQLQSGADHTFKRLR